MKVFLIALTMFALVGVQCVASNLVTNPTATTDNEVSAPNGVTGLTSNSTDSDAVHGNSVGGAGAAFYSENSYGVIAQSLNGTPLWVGQNATQNTSPAMVIQSIDVSQSTASLLEVQDENGNPLLIVNPKGDLQFAPSGSKPTCNSRNEGLMHYTKGSNSTNASLETCDNNHGTYQWTSH